jgi:hypothetical protein
LTRKPNVEPKKENAKGSVPTPPQEAKEIKVVPKGSLKKETLNLTKVGDHFIISENRIAVDKPSKIAYGVLDKDNKTVKKFEDSDVRYMETHGIEFKSEAVKVNNKKSSKKEPEPVEVEEEEAPEVEENAEGETAEPDVEADAEDVDLDAAGDDDVGAAADEAEVEPNVEEDDPANDIEENEEEGEGGDIGGDDGEEIEEEDDAAD